MISLGGVIGSLCRADGKVQFCLWAPQAQKVELHVKWPEDRLVAMERDDLGYYHAIITGRPGMQYFYRLDEDEGREFPDPASRHQPHGVHEPSEVIRPDFPWTDQGWFGLPLSSYIFYELHVGTFTPEGTFEAIIPHLDELKELGITAIELMPIAQFPGERNWGYDGVYPFAAQHSYGGVDGLRRLVDAAHGKGLAVVLDVVYNHMGPEGNYLREFGPYFTSRYKTPWGDAINFDGPENHAVRHFFIQNALYWTLDCHIDALRLDAIHAIKDFSAKPFLEDLAEAVHEQADQAGRRVHLVAESDLNDTRIIQPTELGGFNIDAQWNDDFHHAVHTLLTREEAGYYADFGQLLHLVKAYREGYVYDGEYSVCRRQCHGRSSRAIPARKFVVCTQNHDQIGNRMLGERLSALVPFGALKLAAGAVLLSPYLPLLFMGEEYGETAPFLYFTSHGDAELVEAVRKGRAEEFANFAWKGEVPDPQSEETFVRSRLNHDLRRQGQAAILLEFYKTLIHLRKTHPALAWLSKDNLEAQTSPVDNLLVLRRWKGDHEALAVLHFGRESISARVILPRGEWRCLIDSEDKRWGGEGATTPEQLSSPGEIELSLRPNQLVLLTKGE